jgi:toxin ParE1/3/4
MPFRVTDQAIGDIAHIVRDTQRLFGPLQVEAYVAIIDKAMQMVGDDPERPSSHARPELGPNVRSFHLELAAGRRGGAAHMLYFVPEISPDGTRGAVILRVLHEGMEPRHRVARTLRAHQGGP